MKKAVYPGTFDPMTYGHLDLIKRAVTIFDSVIIGVAHNPFKKPLFSVEERVKMVKKAVQGIEGVEVVSFDGLVIDFVRQNQALVVLRGLRMISDFEYEFQMALTNKKLDNDIEVIFMMPKESYTYLSSRLIKEAASLGANLKDFVPDYIEKALKEKLRDHL